MAYVAYDILGMFFKAKKQQQVNHSRYLYIYLF